MCAEQWERDRAEIERLRAEVKLLEHCLAETTDLAVLQERDRADRAEARLRAVVEAAADWANDIPGGNDLPDANAVGEAIMAAADHERCERCNRDRWEGGPDDELHCPDCIHGWRPKGEDDE